MIDENRLHESNTRLVELMRQQIENHGPLRFYDFMELALYHPEHGYYQSDTPRPGRSGDFLTAPEVDPMFGEVVTQQIIEFWQQLDRPDPFLIIEYGAGAGTLATVILGTLQDEAPDLYSIVRYRPVEINSSRLAAFQQELTTDGHADRIDVDPNDEAVAGCVIANEYLDALPVHRLVQRENGLREIYVGWEQGWFTEREDELSDPAIERELRASGVELEVGGHAEHNPGVKTWIAEVYERLERSYVLMIDYGYPGPDLYTLHRKQGSVRAYYQHGVSTSYYRGVGQQDLTAHVNLTLIEQHAQAAGFHIYGHTDQASFLAALGIGERLVNLQREPDMTIETYMGIRAAVMRLIDPGAMGRFAVQILGKDVPTNPRPTGLTPLPLP